MIVGVLPPRGEKEPVEVRPGAGAHKPDVEIVAHETSANVIIAAVEFRVLGKFGAHQRRMEL